MEEKYFERFFNIEQGLENNGYVELKDKIEKELNEIKENGKLINMYQRVKLKLNKYEAGITEKPILPFIKLIFNPLCSVLLTLGTVFFTVINSLGDIFYNAGMETEASVVKVVESYSEFMYGMYEKGMYLLFVFGGIIVFVYFGAYWHDYKKEQKIKRETLYYKFILEIIEKGLRDRNMEL